MLKLSIAYVATALVFVVMDGAWLSLVGPRLYRPEIGELLSDKVRLAPAIVFYLLYVTGLVYFAVRPGLASGWAQAVVPGLMLGLVAYGAYDLTCQAVMRVWSVKITAGDMIWGAFASAVASAAGAATTPALLRMMGR